MRGGKYLMSLLSDQFVNNKLAFVFVIRMCDKIHQIFERNLEIILNLSYDTKLNNNKLNIYEFD
jgi:hypothetical protein